MNKNEFLNLLQKGLTGLPQEDIDERLNFYSELIDDYIEEGLSEEEALSRIGSASAIAAQIVADASPAEPAAKEKKHRSTWKTAMIIVGSPIWLSLLIAAFAVVFSLYVSLWSIIISLWSVFGALCSCAFAGLLCGIALGVTGYVFPGLAMIGASLVCGGLSILAFFGCNAATKGTVLLTKKLAVSIKASIRKKEDA